MKILLPIDGSDYTRRVLTYIASNDQLLGAGHEYTLFTAIGPLPPHVTRFLDRRTIDDYYFDEAERVLEPARVFAVQKGWKAVTAYVDGHAAEAIATFAENGKYDLIVMGTHGHSSLGNVVLGSVASGVLARCKVPVLLIR